MISFLDFPPSRFPRAAAVLVFWLATSGLTAAGAAQWFVAAGGGGNGMSAAAPFGRIADALARAQPGDRVVISPGDYIETLVNAKPGLTIAAAEPVLPGPLASVRIISRGGPVLTERADASWYGIEFHAAGERNDTVRLEGASGQFIRCRFSSLPREGFTIDSARALVRIFGGSPTFYASSFVGDHAAGVGAIASNGAAPRFAYCFFSDLVQTVVQLSEADSSVWIANALMARCGPAVTRARGSAGAAEVVNSVLFLVRGGLAALSPPTAPPVRFRHCLHAPAPGDHLGFQLSYDLASWRASLMETDIDPGSLAIVSFEKQTGVQAENCLSGSPRFLGGRQPIRINATIDDTHHARVAHALSDVAERHGFRITWAINTHTAAEAEWEIARDLLRRGHEIGSHSVSHVPLVGVDPLQVGYSPPDAKEVLLSIRPDLERPPEKVLAVTVDGRPEIAIPLTVDPVLTVGELVLRLRRAGVMAEAHPSSRGVSSHTLANIDDLDIRVPQARSPLALDIDAFLRYELASSREAIEKNTGASVAVLIYPYSSFAPMIRERLVRAFADPDSKERYLYARDGVAKPYPPTAAAADPFHITGYTLVNTRTTASLASWQDIFEVLLDNAADSGAPLSFFSHGFDEFTLEQWDELFTIAKSRRNLVFASLEELGRQATAESRIDNAEADARIVLEPDIHASMRPISETTLDMYRPAPNSPLPGKGVPVGLKVDFAGNPVPPGAPAIGLFQ